MSQDLGVGLQHVVENMEAVNATDLWAPVHRTDLWVVQVFVGAHESKQFHLYWADLLGQPFGVGGLVQTLPACLQQLVENGEVCVFL